MGISGIVGAGLAYGGKVAAVKLLAYVASDLTGHVVAQWSLDAGMGPVVAVILAIFTGYGVGSLIDNVADSMIEGIRLQNQSDEPLKLSTKFLNKKDELWKNADNIKPIEGYQDIVCHGDRYSFVFKNANGVETNISVEEFAEILRNSSVYDGGPIRLISCETGAEGAISAQYLANYLGVEVMAPTDIVYVYLDGSMKIGLDDSGFWKIFKPGGK